MIQKLSAARHQGADLSVAGDESLALVTPHNANAKAWLEAHTDGQWLGRNLAVEWRYLGDLVRGLEDDGFTVTRSA